MYASFTSVPNFYITLSNILRFYRFSVFTAASGRIGAFIAQFINGYLIDRPVHLLLVASGTLLLGATTPFLLPNGAKGGDMTGRPVNDNLLGELNSGHQQRRCSGSDNSDDNNDDEESMIVNNKNSSTTTAGIVHRATATTNATATATATATTTTTSHLTRQRRNSPTFDRTTYTN